MTKPTTEEANPAPRACERCGIGGGTTKVRGFGFWHPICWKKATPTQKQAAADRAAAAPRPGDVWEAPSTIAGALVREGCGMADCGPCRALVGRESRVFVALAKSELQALILVAQGTVDVRGNSGAELRGLVRRVLQAQARRPLGCVHPQRDGVH